MSQTFVATSCPSKAVHNDDVSDEGDLRVKAQLIDAEGTALQNEAKPYEDFGEPSVKIEPDVVEEALVQEKAADMDDINDLKAEAPCFDFVAIKEEPYYDADIDQGEPVLTKDNVELTIDDHNIDLKAEEASHVQNLSPRKDQVDPETCSPSQTSSLWGPVTSLDKTEFGNLATATPTIINQVTNLMYARNEKLISLAQTGKKIYKCEHCNKCFTERSNLRRHTRIHSGEKNYKCEECGKCFTLHGNLTTHLRTHSGKKDYICEHCGKSFRSCAHLKRHYTIHSGEKNYRCVECGNFFAHDSSLKRHLKIHSCEKDYKCEDCGKCFGVRDHLKAHLTIHSDEKNYKCEECGKCFSRLDNLKSHVRVHSGRKDFKCQVCGRCFALSSTLKCHVRVHSGRKDFKCQVCGRCFALSSTLKCHLRIHLGQKVLST